MYASKLICIVNPPNIYESSTDDEPQYRNIPEMSNDIIKTLTCIYELVCHLCHVTCMAVPKSLNQFIDAVTCFKVNDLLSNILISPDTRIMRLKATILALFACVLQESAENADLIESIIFDSNLKIVNELLKLPNSLCRYRTLVLLRLCGRFSCVALQQSWTNEIKVKIQELTKDADVTVKNEAVDLLQELRNLSFFDLQK